MVKKTTCPRKYSNAQMLKYDKKYKYYGAQQVYFKGPVAQKGFDLTSVNAKRWEAFKKKYGLKLARKSPKEVYGSKPHVFFSDKECVVVVTGNVSKEGKEKYLSYMRFETPKNRKSVLENMMKDFRGPKNVGCCDVEPPKGNTAVYVKKEEPYRYPPKDYAGFI